MKNLILDDEGTLKYGESVINQIDTKFLLELFEDGIKGEVSFSIADGQELTKFLNDIKDTLKPDSEFMIKYKKNIEVITNTKKQIQSLSGLEEKNDLL